MLCKMEGLVLDLNAQSRIMVWMHMTLEVVKEEPGKLLGLVGQPV